MLGLVVVSHMCMYSCNHEIDLYYLNLTNDIFLIKNK